MTIDKVPDRDPNPDEAYEEQVTECAGCLDPLHEDDQWTVDGDVLCLVCAADAAWPLVTAELMPHTQLRSLPERWSALAIAEEVCRIAKEAIARQMDRSEHDARELLHAMCDMVRPPRPRLAAVRYPNCPHGCETEACADCAGRET